MDEYFKISATQNRRYAEVHGPQDSQGNYFPDIGRVGSHECGICRCVDKRTRLADCIYCVTDFVISQRAASVFTKFSLPDGTTFLPVNVVAKNGNNLGPMVVVIFPEILEVADLTESKFEKLSTGHFWYFTEPPVVRATDLRALDLLRDLHVRFLCSGKLRREIQREELTNFMFEDVVVK